VDGIFTYLLSLLKKTCQLHLFLFLTQTLSNKKTGTNRKQPMSALKSLLGITEAFCFKIARKAVLTTFSGDVIKHA
jgi:hypothetical protein